LATRVLSRKAEDSRAVLDERVVLEHDQQAAFKIPKLTKLSAVAATASSRARGVQCSS
jgi:hypothetical protein